MFSTNKLIKNKFIENKKNIFETNGTKKMVKHKSSYLDELNETGQTVLYQHLMEIHKCKNTNDKIAVCRSLTFPQFASIVNNMRQLIIENVDKELRNVSSHIVFLLGKTGSGKTTTICYLRGDKMEQVGINYDSEDTNADCKIGHSISTSTTFFPYVEQVGPLKIVDFPGFEATDGIAIQLGILLGIKALLFKFNPKVLIFSPLINNPNRASFQLDTEPLKDLLGENINDCMLALTKYSYNYHYTALLKKSHEIIRQQELHLKALKETKCEGLLNNVINDKKKELDNSKLRDSEKKITPSAHHDQIQKTENELLQKFGMSKMLSFPILDNDVHRKNCLNKLMQQNNVTVPSPILNLKSEYMDLLELIFNNGLKENGFNSEKAEHFIEFKTIDQLKEHINQYSFMHAIQDKAVGDFLHLAEVDPTIVQNFDIKLIEHLIANYIDSINKLNLPVIEELLFTLEPPPLVKQFLIALKGLENQANRIGSTSREAGKLKEHKSIEAPDTNNMFVLPNEIKSLTFINLKKPTNLFSLMEARNTEEARKKLNHYCIQEINDIYNNLSSFCIIKRAVLHKQDNICNKKMSKQLDTINANANANANVNNKNASQPKCDLLNASKQDNIPLMTGQSPSFFQNNQPEPLETAKAVAPVVDSTRIIYN